MARTSQLTWTPEHTKRYAALRKQGANRQEIADAMGITLAILNRAITRHKLGRAMNPTVEWTDQHTERLIELRDDGDRKSVV